MKSLRPIASALLALTALTTQAQPLVVTTDHRYARGATMAFGRMTVHTGGATVSQQGFCLSQDPEPTIGSTLSSKTLSHNGTIYYFDGLQPSTRYYMRAWARTTGGDVAYGDVIKFYTLPKGHITYWYNNGGDAAANERINAAATQACDIFSQLTSIKKHFAIGYSAGTPTADCDYKDEPWMNMGPNAAYQRTGTIMHEMQHGLGLVPYSTQWSKDILRERLDGSGRGSGHWLGRRVSALLDFWMNTSGSQLNGDYQHMWPYGINGAHEDDGTLALYYANALIAQALGEDGLEHRSATFADPCYALPHEEGVKYYLKCESPDRGLYTAYLAATAAGVLQWAPMTAGEAAADDRAAWYVSFTPGNQYYQLRNAATGQYLTYDGGTIRTAARTTLTAGDDWHLMAGRTDVGGLQGYWVIHPTTGWSPDCLQAAADGATATATFDLRDAATAQRWLILTQAQAQAVEALAAEHGKAELGALISSIRAMAATAHHEDARGADRRLTEALDDITARAAASTTAAPLAPLAREATDAAMAFLRGVTPQDDDKPFDLTWMVSNPTVSATTEGWTTTVGITDQRYGCVEYYQKTFDFYQDVGPLPAGDYGAGVQAFQRPGWAGQCSGASVTSTVYVGGGEQPLAHAVSCSQAATMGGKEALADGRYIPDDMQAAAIYFDHGLYANLVKGRLAADGGTLRIGLRCTASAAGYWTIFRNFHLYYYGHTVKGDVNRDGTVDRRDADALVGHLVGLTPDVFAPRAADINGDGRADIVDVTLLTDSIRQKQQ